MPELTRLHFIGNQRLANQPTDGYPEATLAEVQQAAELAASRFRSPWPDSDRAAFLDAVAEEIEALGDLLLETASRESNLPIPRLTGERGRTCAQLRMFAQEVREGRTRPVRHVPALPDRQPLLRPDLRRILRPLGPVAVFGASNFPLAFSVAGGDTASAWAAGCPVVVKAHPAHPETSELVGLAVLKAAERTGAGEGVFSMLFGSASVGEALAKAEPIRAIAFTGSQRAGLALAALGAAREVPIPVFAEMGSINPVFVLPGAPAAFATGYADSLTLGVGQFCTNPGVIVGIRGEAWDSFVEAIRQRLSEFPGGKMLTEAIGESYVEAAAQCLRQPHVQTLIPADGAGKAGFGIVRAGAFLASKALQLEVFGPFGIAATADSWDEVLEVAHGIEGQLTATILFGEGDEAQVAELTHALVDRVGRLVFNGFPTGVEVNEAMHHGGPYPATTDTRFTSVGTAAVERFLRPVSLQNVPDSVFESL